MWRGFPVQLSNSQSRSRGALRPGFDRSVAPRKKEGAGNAGCALHPRSRVPKVAQLAHTSIQGSGNTPTSPAQWLYGLLRALPGERIRLVTVDCGKLPANLAPATGVRTTRLGRTLRRFVRRQTTPDAKASTASRTPRVATIMIRPSCGRETGEVIILIYRIVKRNIF